MTRGTTNGLTWEFTEYLDGRPAVTVTVDNDDGTRAVFAPQELPAAISALRAALRADREQRTVGWRARCGCGWSQPKVKDYFEACEQAGAHWSSTRCRHTSTVVRLLRRRAR
jgi:hypothetical protein